MTAAQTLAKNMELIADDACHIGENPLWNSDEKKLYWTDIPTGRLFRFDPSTGTREQIYRGRPVGGFVFAQDGGLMLFMDGGSIARWNDGELRLCLGGIEDEADSRFNDVIADPAGRVFCGTMSTSDHKGRLYRLDTDGSLQVVLTGIGCSNGMTFSLDRKSFFFTDSFARQIYRFDYDVTTGAIMNRTTFATFSEADGLPDGLTIDSEGRLWSALWGGGCVVRLNDRGEIAERVPVPTPKSSSLTFGGSDLRTLYITTAGGNERAEGDVFAGALFRTLSTAQGIPEFRSGMRAEAITLIQ